MIKELWNNLLCLIKPTSTYHDEVHIQNRIVVTGMINKLDKIFEKLLYSAKIIVLCRCLIWYCGAFYNRSVSIIGECYQNILALLEFPDVEEHAELWFQQDRALTHIC